MDNSNNEIQKKREKKRLKVHNTQIKPIFYVNRTIQTQISAIFTNSSNKRFLGSPTY